MENSTQNYVRAETQSSTISSNTSYPNIINPKTTVSLTSNQITSIPKRKIGKNYIFNCLGIKKVIGIPDTLFAYILTNLGMFIVEFGWIITNNFYFPYQIYLIQLIFYFLTIYYMFICFFKDPGIIPRYNPNFQIKEEEINEMIKKEKEENEKEEKDQKEENDNKENKENKEETKLNIQENNNNKEEKSKLKLPSILQERKCETCHIIKPPKTSHCRFCDNCIQGLDHHCFFISNCVGIRNHKDFLFFCFYGSIGCVQIVIYCFIHVIYVLFRSNFPLWTSIFNGNKILFSISLLLMIYGITYVSMGGMDFGLISFTVGSGIGIFIFLFYKYVPLKNAPLYFNPISLLFFGGSCGFFGFVFGTFLVQISNISMGYTIKQKACINREYIESIRRQEYNVDRSYIKKKSFRERIENVKKFITMEIPESLIDFDRDI